MVTGSDEVDVAAIVCLGYPLKVLLIISCSKFVCASEKFQNDYI